MRPIPKKLLIHSAVLRHPTDTDAFQNKTYSETPLSFVRIEPSSRTVKTKDNTEVTLSAVLFFDRTHSLPSDIRFEHGDRIIMCAGTEYEIKTIQPLYDGSRLHHIELGLM